MMNDRNPIPLRHGRTLPPNPKPSRKSNPPAPGLSPPSNAKSDRNNGSNSGNITPARAGRRRARIVGEDPESQHRLVEKFPVKNLVMGQVTILKRGEERKPKPVFEDSRRPRQKAAAVEADGDDLVLFSTDQFGPDPELLPKKSRPVDPKSAVYAGAGFFSSPSPSSLPFPTSLFAKKEIAKTTDLATQSLRYLLRLDLL